MDQYATYPNSNRPLHISPTMPLPALPQQAVIVVEPFPQHAPPSAPGLTTYDDAYGGVGMALGDAPVPEYSTSSMSAVCHEKDAADYFRQRRPEREQHWTDNAPSYAIQQQQKRPGAPVLSINTLPAPPKAAFLEHPPASPSSSSFLSARELYADSMSMPSTPKRAEAKHVFNQSIDWTRFSVMLHKASAAEDDESFDEKKKGGDAAGRGGGGGGGQQSDWLRRKQSIGKKWTRIGAVGAVVVVAVVVGVVIFCVQRVDGKQPPEVLSLGDFGGPSGSSMAAYSTGAAGLPSVSSQSVEPLEVSPSDTSAIVVIPATTASGGSSTTTAAAIVTTSSPAAAQLTTSTRAVLAPIATPATTLTTRAAVRETRATTTASTVAVVTATTASTSTTSSTTIVTAAARPTPARGGTAAREEAEVKDEEAEEEDERSRIRDKRALVRRHFTPTTAPTHLSKRFFNPIHVDYAEFYTTESIFPSASELVAVESGQGEADEYMRVKQDKLRLEPRALAAGGAWQDIGWTRVKHERARARDLRRDVDEDGA